MTVFRSVVIDKGRKHIGSVVIKRKNGESVASEMPIHVKNPKTIGQVNQRTDFSTVIEFAKVNSQVAAFGFTTTKKGSTRMNAMFKDIFKNGTAGGVGSKTIDYPNVKLTRGSLINESGMVITNVVAGTLVCTYPNSSGTGNALATDKLFVATYNLTKKETNFQAGLAARSASPYNLTIPLSWSGDTVKIYTGFKSVNGKLVTTSFFAGSHILT